MAKKSIFNTSRLTPPVKFLVPGLCLGTHCHRGSASLRNASETRMLDDSAGRACKPVGSKAEPWSQSMAISEKCRIFKCFMFLFLFQEVDSFQLRKELTHLWTANEVELLSNKCWIDRKETSANRF